MMPQSVIVAARCDNHVVTESVWDYPRPPRVESSAEIVELTLAGELIARSTDTVRVLETSHPPTYYLPTADFRPGVLQPAADSSWCEWKGQAVYYDLVVHDVRVDRGAWGYPQPTAGFTKLLDLVAVYPAALDRCTVDGEEVRAQAGGFYGGWVTDRVIGPFKGEPGTAGW